MIRFVYHSATVKLNEFDFLTVLVNGVDRVFEYTVPKGRKAIVRIIVEEAGIP